MSLDVSPELSSIDATRMQQALTEASILLDLAGRFPASGVGEGRDPEGTTRITVAGRTFRGATRLDALVAARDGLATSVEQSRQH